MTADSWVMPTQFDHDKLDVYRLAIEFASWVGIVIDEPLCGARIGAIKHLDEASTSISLNIAEGNGKRSAIDRARFLDIARGSALECAACLDIVVARRKLEAHHVVVGKETLVRVVSMLTKLIERLVESSTSASTTSRAR
jgi:four helix bundle protein